MFFEQLAGGEATRKCRAAKKTLPNFAHGRIDLQN